MRIYLTRHGQTRYNKGHYMQGRTDEPLNETGIAQAEAMRDSLRRLCGDVKFDAVYSSPLNRAVMTGSIIGCVDPEDIIRDERLIETDFGKYELTRFPETGVRFSLYWVNPFVFPPPETVESVESMVARSHSFLRDLEQMPYEHVLVSCHGGILRAMCGYMEDRKSGLKWWPRPKNCEVRIYDSVDGRHEAVGGCRI